LFVHSVFGLRVLLGALVLAAGFISYGQARAAGDAAAGKTVFANQCSSCHTVEVGKNGFGPSLAAVLGRKAGGLAGFAYSPARAQAGLIWMKKISTSSSPRRPRRFRERRCRCSCRARATGPT